MIYESNEDAYSLMIKKYEPLIAKQVAYFYHKYKNFGIDKEELFQEGIIGLINAVNSYKIQDKCIFYTFASLVIKREMERYIKRCTRNKNLILTLAASTNELIGKDDLVLEDTLYIASDNVEYVASNNYYDNILYNFKYELNDLQSQIYELRLNNFSNHEISKLLDINYKYIDNAIRLMKVKFKNYIQSYL